MGVKKRCWVCFFDWMISSDKQLKLAFLNFSPTSRPFFFCLPYPSHPLFSQAPAPLSPPTNIRALILLICHWEFTDGLVQGKLNIDEYFWIPRISRGEKWHEVLIIVEGSRLTACFFQIYVTFLHKFSKYIWFAMQCYWFISLVILVNKCNFSHPAPTHFSPPLFMFFWIPCLTKYDKTMF